MHPFCPQKVFSVQHQQENLGAPVVLSTLQGVRALGLQDTALPQPPGSRSNFLTMLADIQALDSRPGYITLARAWDKLSALGEARSPVKSHALSASFGQLAQAFMLPQRVLCLREFSYLLLFTVLGAPLERQASVLAVDSVMWYVVQLHGVHGLAETCGVALPGELFPQHGPLRATCVFQGIYVSRNPTDLPFQASHFFGYFFSHRLKNFPETLH